ncbi:hypothetical protein Q1695_003968 [Nippostrongylus brasiliensis]|nr:hypothetical protein Q1695_003968 [Nippostrongylus brasiliensis]
MWLHLLANLQNISASESTFAYQDQQSSYLRFITNLDEHTSVAPCVLQDLVRTSVVDEASFTCSLVIWLYVIFGYVYARHRARMVIREQLRYDSHYIINQWFDEQKQMEKGRGVHEIDYTVRDRDFRYDDVRIPKVDFTAFCRCLTVLPQHRYYRWAAVLYVNRTVHCISAALSLLTCFVGSFALVYRAIYHETEMAEARVSAYDIVEAAAVMLANRQVVPDYRWDNQLCDSSTVFNVELLDKRQQEIVDVAVRNLLRGANDAITRITSITLVFFAFCVYIKLWLVAYVTSTIWRPSSNIRTIGRGNLLTHGIFCEKETNGLSIFI